MPRFVDPDRIFAYEYRCQNDSVLFPVYRRWVCEPLVDRLPESISPNMVTLLANAASVGVFLFLVGAFGPVSSSGELGRGIFLLPALGIFVYVALDNSDGIQARRLGVSSPLGDFIDHWLDGFSSFMVPLGPAVAYGASPHWRVPIVLVAITAFWATAWEKRNTGVMRLAPVSDVEGNTAAMLTHVATALFGLAFWRAVVFGFSLIDLLAGAVVLGFGLVAVGALWKDGRRSWELLGLAMSAGLVLLWWYRLHTMGSTTAGSLWIPILLGLMGVKHVGDLQRQHLMGTRYRAFDVGFLTWGAALAASTWVPGLGHEAAQGALLTASVVFVTARLLYQFFHTVLYVRHRLGIPVLRVPPERGTKATGGALPT